MVFEKKRENLWKMRTSLVLMLIIVGTDDAFGMTRAQLKKTLTVMKKQCIPKIGVSEDKIKDIEQGVFIEDRKVMCYVACIYKNIQVVKNERLDRVLVNKQVDILYPADMKEAVKKGVDKCCHIQDNYDNLCEAAFYAAKCLYESDPSNFVFP